MVWFTGGGNGNPFQYSCSKYPMTSMKRQKDMRKVSPPGWKVSNMLYGEEYGEELKAITNNGGGNGTPFQYPRLENPMDRGAWWAAVHGVATSLTQLSDFTFTFHFHTLEEEMATHSRILAWRIPGMGEPGGLPSMGSHRVGHD